jgi:signal transduction histidine kinase/YHS domain-containing protein
MWILICLLETVLMVAAYWWLFYRVLNPLKHLAQSAEDLTKGDFTVFEQPCNGIAEIEVLRRSMEGMVGHLLRAQEQNQTYAEILTNGQEVERARIARELHDETVQSMIAIAQSLDMLKTWVTTDSDKALQMIQLARAQTLDSVDALRDLIGNLRPPALDELGLVTALQMQADKTTDLAVTVSVEGIARRLKHIHELTLFRCAQEALNNACRHSQAKNVVIKVIYQPHQTILSVSDDGIGFTPAQQLATTINDGHYGLMGIQERVQHLHGTFDIDSAQGRGTTLHITIPEDEINQPQQTIRDPVCSAVIEPQQAYGSVEHDGKQYYFCCPVCQGAFQREPEMYT